MYILLLEALGAGLLFIGIIWWTMFSGRDNGEIVRSDAPEAPSPDTAKNEEGTVVVTQQEGSEGK
jgi:hypothetical protein